MNNSSNSSSGNGILGGLINGDAGTAQSTDGITTKAFALNLAIGIGLFFFEITGFFFLRSSEIGRRIYQPKTYLVQDRLRVEAIPRNLLKWIYKVFMIKDEELRVKCGLDGYFFIRFIRAMIVIFLPLMIIIPTILLPINFNGGRGTQHIHVAGHIQTYNVTGLDTLSWQNVSPAQTNRYWAHLLCALLAITWTLYRIYCEKLHFIEIRQQFLTSPNHRLKASARTILVTNIPSEYQSKEALKTLYDVFVDNDDRSKLHVWLNRDYSVLRALTSRRRKIRHALEKEELRIIRLVNKRCRADEDIEADEKHVQMTSDSAAFDESAHTEMSHPRQHVSAIFEADCLESEQLWHKYLDRSKEALVTIAVDGADKWKSISPLRFWNRGHTRTIPKTAWLRAEIAQLNVEIEDSLTDLDNETRFKRQNSAFIQFDRQMSAHMACSLVSHHRPRRMTPRFLDVAPHEILWANMGVTSREHYVRTCFALLLFLAMIFLWSLPTTFLGFLSQLETLRSTTPWLSWLQTWPSWIISLISGPITSILLALLIQLVVPALCRKLATLMGSPTRSKREVLTQNFYFIFLFIELVLVTSISSGIVATIPLIIQNPTSVPTTLATDLPKAANYFFNYLIIQALGFSGSILFQYLRILYVTTIWPWFTQTPREEAWLQTTIPHQMWGNVYPLFTNFAVIGLIYSITAPLIIIFVSATFVLFWFAYRHNYYYVQRNKVDSHGMVFENALSQLYTGVYVLEVTLIGLFFLVRNSAGNLACTPQAIIIIVALALTITIHYLQEQNLRPLYELLPVTLEDAAAEAEKRQFLNSSNIAQTHEQDENCEAEGVELSNQASISGASDSIGDVNGRLDEPIGKQTKPTQIKGIAATAAKARKTLLRLREEATARIAETNEHTSRHAIVSRRRDVAEQLGAAIRGFPDELTDLSPKEQDAELKAAYQDPVTREPTPVIWLPQDRAGISDYTVIRARRYGSYLQYSNTGAYLTRANKCEVTQPAPDVRPDWLLDWML